MREPRHRPGPWRVVPGTPGSLDVLACPPGDDGALVASDITNEADAQLIASSPELLLAAMNVLAQARKHTDGSARLDAAWLDDLRKAVNEANGVG